MKSLWPWVYFEAVTLGIYPYPSEKAFHKEEKYTGSSILFGSLYAFQFTPAGELDITPQGFL